MTASSRTRAILISGFVCGVTLLPAQQPATPQAPSQTTSKDDGTYVLKENVRRVVLDVVVTDSQGRPVSDLAPGDFTVLEDGQPQPVRSFEAHNSSKATKFTPPNLPALPTNTYFDLPKTEESGPLYVIVYDAVNIAAEDQQRARKELMAFLTHKPAGSRFALFLWSTQIGLIQGFTSDPNKLLEAFDIHRKGTHIPYTFLMADNTFNGDCAAPFKVMTFLAQYLEGFPGRKNVIWLTSGLPSQMGTLVASAFETTYAYDYNANASGSSASTTGSASNGGEGTGPATASTINTSDLQRAEGSAGDCVVPTGGHEMIDSLATAQVAIYPVMVHGADMRGPGFDDTADVIAKATGGRAYFNLNDIQAVIADATDDGANYYEITYSPSNTKLDSKRRGISVKLAKKGYRLSYRRFYFADDPESFHKDDVKLAKAQGAGAQPASQSDKFLAFMRHGAPISHEIVFQAHFGTQGTPVMATSEQMTQISALAKASGSKSVKPMPLQTYAVDITVLGNELLMRAKANPDVEQTLTLAAAAYDEDGNMLTSVVQSAVVPPNSPGAKPVFRLRQEISVPKEGKWLRVAVRDPVSNHVGAMEIELPLLPEDANQAAKSN